jgi:hypothetical protein
MLSGQVSGAIYLPFSVRTAPHPGDSVRASAWLQIQPVRFIATRFGARTRVEATGEITPGAADPNSGGFVGYATTDILVSPTTDLVLALGAAFPMVQAWIGLHRESAIASAQVAYDF